jgi:hypothetical protein
MTMVDHNKLRDRTLYYYYYKIMKEWIPVYIERDYNYDQRIMVTSCKDHGSQMCFTVNRSDIKTDLQLFMEGINPQVEHNNRVQEIRQKWNTKKN